MTSHDKDAGEVISLEISASPHTSNPISHRADAPNQQPEDGHPCTIGANSAKSKMSSTLDDQASEELSYKEQSTAVHTKPPTKSASTGVHQLNFSKDGGAEIMEVRAPTRHHAKRQHGPMVTCTA